MQNDYEILGLSYDASQSDIKRAYFKLIRKYTPEKDPENFMRIRTAYENLTEAGNQSTGPVFEPLKDPGAQQIRLKIEAALREGNLPQTAEICEAAVKLYPDEEYFLYQLLSIYRRFRKTGKAVKTAERLCKANPGSIPYAELLADAYLARGFINKAFDQLEDIYERGSRNPDLINQYCYMLTDRGYLDDAYHTYIELIGCFDKINRDQAELFTDICLGIILLSEDIYNINPGYQAVLPFMIRNQKYISIEDGNILSSVYISAKRKVLESETKSLIQEYDDLVKKKLSAERYNDLKAYIEDYSYYEMKRSLLIDEDIKALYDAARVDKQYRNYAQTDAKLIILKNREDIDFSLSVLHDLFRDLYDEYADFFEILGQDEISIRKYENSLKQIYRELSETFSGGSYYQRYPQERKAKIKTGPIMPQANRTKVSRPLVGRNEKCPCGSGKKFKKCCMGKRIYD